MLKKTRGEILAPLDQRFEKRVAQLELNGRTLAKSYADLTVRMLNFAEQFRALWSEAATLDNADNGRHHNHLREKIAAAVQSDSAVTWSKWNTIGSQAQKLLKYKDALPPQRESLYEMALALNEKKPIDKWIERGALTHESTVREVSALRRSKKRKSRPRAYLASVTFSFQTYEEAAGALKEIACSSADFRIQSHKAFDEALKAQLGTAKYEIARKHLG